LDKNNIVGNHGDTSTTPFSKSLQSMNHLDAVTMKKAAGSSASASSSSAVVAGAGAAVVAINDAFQDTPRVDDWYKDVIVRMEEKMNNNSNNISRGNVVGFQSCRRRVAKSRENADYYYSIEPLAACRTTTAEKRTRKFVYFNPYPRPRILCGHTLAANNGTLELDEPACLEPARLFPVIPSLETALELPPTITRFNDPGQQGQVEPFADCDIPCHHGGYLNLLSTRTIDGTPFQLTFSMEGQQYYPMLRIKDAAYRDNVFYSTTSFRSEVPLPYFSYAEYNIQKLPAVDYNTAEKAAVFLARNCGSISQREALVTALHESGHFRIDSLSDCLHNAEPPNGIDLGDKINVMRHYLFYLAFENQRVNGKRASISRRRRTRSELPVK
jgi:Glycosyltransferase family 10 (fucosyltransferase) C-term